MFICLVGIALIFKPVKSLSSPPIFGHCLFLRATFLHMTPHTLGAWKQLLKRGHNTYNGNFRGGQAFQVCSDRQWQKKSDRAQFFCSPRIFIASSTSKFSSHINCIKGDQKRNIAKIFFPFSKPPIFNQIAISTIEFEQWFILDTDLAFENRKKVAQFLSPLLFLGCEELRSLL